MIIVLFLSIIFILKIIDRLFPIFPKQRISQSLYKFSKKKKENKKKGKNKHDFLKKKKKKRRYNFYGAPFVLLLTQKEVISSDIFSW